MSNFVGDVLIVLILPLVAMAVGVLLVFVLTQVWI